MKTSYIIKHLVGTFFFFVLLFIGAGRFDYWQGLIYAAVAQPGEAVIPVSTYRLQFNTQFTFSDATPLVSYLRQLGISHCYAPPYLKARPGRYAP